VTPALPPSNHGLDTWILGDVVKTLHLFQEITLSPLIDPKDVVVGILDYTECNEWTSYREVKAFDMYIEKYVSQGKIRTHRWINGIRLG